jgi:hypothetical protein
MWLATAAATVTSAPARIWACALTGAAVLTLAATGTLLAARLDCTLARAFIARPPDTEQIAGLLVGALAEAVRTPGEATPRPAATGDVVPLRARRRP